MTRVTVNNETFEVDGANVAVVNDRIIADGVDVTDTATRVPTERPSGFRFAPERDLIFPATREMKRCW